MTRPILERKKVEVQPVYVERFPDYEILIWREDQNHPTIQGNKWWKLKCNLEEYAQGDYTNIVSFGGAFSNHVYALAAACNELGIPLTCFIRGDGFDQNNPILQKVKAWGCTLIFLDRTAYRRKEAQKVEEYFKKHSNAFLIPEGGSNELGFKGCVEWGEVIKQKVQDIDYLCVSAGTGTTASGLIEAFKETSTRVIVFPAMKGNFMQDEIAKWTEAMNWEINSEYHFGGFAKVKEELVDAIRKTKLETGVSLDPVYTGKLMFGIIDLLQNDFFPTDSKVLMIHTGGLMGVQGYNYLNGNRFGEL